MDAWGSFDRDIPAHRLGGAMPDPDPVRDPLSRSWEEISARAGRNDLPGLLVTAVGTGVLSDPAELRIALENTWTLCEWPGLAATKDLWLTLFGMAVEPGTYLEETQLQPIATLPTTLQVYRAAAPGHEDGLSWTTSFDRAHWFATRLGAISQQPHRIYEMDAPRDWVLASFHESRQEYEYIIDTTQVEGDVVREVLPEEWEYLLAAAHDNKADEG